MDIHARDIEVQLPGGRKLFRVRDFKVQTGRHVLIQGESGSGKTTWLHVLAGLLRPNVGNVRLGSTELRPLGEAALAAFRRAHVGVIFQKLNLIDHLTVGENVRLALPVGLPFAERVREALGEVRLAERASDLTAPLSLGEQQRVAVARVLAQRPEIILADEPTSSLDAGNADFVIRALKTAARGKTLIVVSHDQRLTTHFDRVLNFRELHA